MQPLPLDTESFRLIRASEKPKLYVDKTAYLYRLITDDQSRNFFLARPRRFGKSLMISTLEEIFLGHRELFKGLAIDKADYDWKVYPVIHLDMGKCAADCLDDFIRMLPVEMERALGEAGYAYEKDLLPASNFGKAIDALAAKGLPCVVLIDEYDDPVARALKRSEDAEAIRGKLSSVYGQLKTRTDKVRFLMITGVSKFCKMSVFSTISNLVDLSFRADLVADHPCGTYIFELKVDRPAALATTQAERRQYALPYLAAGKPIWVVGLSFDSKTHELVDHCVERFNGNFNKGK